MEHGVLLSPFVVRCALAGVRPAQGGMYHDACTAHRKMPSAVHDVQPRRYMVSICNRRNLGGKVHGMLECDGCTAKYRQCGGGCTDRVYGHTMLCGSVTRMSADREVQSSRGAKIEGVKLMPSFYIICPKSSKYLWPASLALLLYTLQSSSSTSSYSSKLEVSVGESIVGTWGAGICFLRS